LLTGPFQSLTLRDNWRTVRRDQMQQINHLDKRLVHVATISQIALHFTKVMFSVRYALYHLKPLKV